MASSDNDLRKRSLKSFIKVGVSFIDIKSAVGFSFYRDPSDYVGVQFIYETGKALNAPLHSRKELSQFLLEVDDFIDSDVAMRNINDLIKEIESLPIPDEYNEYMKQAQKIMEETEYQDMPDDEEDEDDDDGNSEYDDGYGDLD